MSDALANQIAKLFIARPDVKAVQVSQGYMPHADRRADEGSGYFPWTRQALNEHINGTRSYGHYMLSKDSQVKLFAFDIDLQKEGWVPLDFDAAAGDHDFVHVPDLRAAWQNRAHPGRPFIKYQLKSVAHMLAKTVTELLELPCAVAYSGNKGLHVYAFTGLIDAADARVGAQIVMDELVRFKPTKGDNFFVDTNDNKLEGFQNLSIEVFPKQDSLDGKTLGNLMRLPLGKNLKSKDPTFFVDMTSPIGQLVPVDSEFALQGNPWRSVND